MPEAVVVSAVRTPVGRAPKGALSTTRPDDLAALAVGAGRCSGEGTGAR
jgi:acetyl-CoA acyltransferase